MFQRMDHTPSAPQPATAPPETPDPKLAAGPADLDPELIESILASGQDVRPGHETREDGWTPQRIGTFLNALAEWGIVSDAAKQAGMTRQAAYALRNSAKGRAFQLAWRAAFLLARRRIADDLMSRAVNGQVDQIYRDGELWRERRRLDNRLGLALLTRLDRIAAEDEIDPAASLVADEFEQFVAIVSKGGEGAADFVRNRARLSRERREADALQRVENYDRYGGGHPREIDISDLPVDGKSGWTDEQIERARQAGVLREMLPSEWDFWDCEPLPFGKKRYVIVLPGGERVGYLDV
jgi:hypothetical protein